MDFRGHLICVSLASSSLTAIFVSWSIGSVIPPTSESPGIEHSYDSFRMSMWYLQAAIFWVGVLIAVSVGFVYFALFKRKLLQAAEREQRGRESSLKTE